MEAQDFSSSISRHPCEESFQKTIRSSWKRCVHQYGLNPGKVPKPTVLTRAEFQRQTDPIEEFVALAGPEVRRLFHRMNGAGYLTSVATASGTIILNQGEHDLNGVTKSIGLIPGSVWSEAEKGTNGIGTCIYTQQTVSVMSNEHFDETLKTMTCAVTPVFGPNGQLQCLISTATDRPSDDRVERLIRGALIHSAHRIENAYFTHYHRGARIVRIADDIDFVDGASEACLAIDGNDNIVDATSNLAELLVVGRDEVVGRTFSETFAANRQLESFVTPKALGPGLGKNSCVYARYETRPTKWHRTGSDPQGAATVSTELNKPEARSTAMQSVRARVLDFVDENFRNAGLNPLNIATECGISRSYLYKVFADDKPVMEHLKHRRLKAACEMIRIQRKRVSLTAVAMACGFTSSSEFSRLFKKEFGVKPSDY